MSENKPSLAKPEVSESVVRPFRSKEQQYSPQYRYVTSGKRMKLAGRKAKSPPPMLPEPHHDEWEKRGLPKPTRNRPEVCDCCGKLPTEISNMGRQKSLALDHDHETVLFRGWLCSRCNRGLDIFGDSFDGLEKAYNYLKRHRDTV